MTKPDQKYYFDYVLVLGLGICILAGFYLQSQPRLSDHDEIIYSVMGRNIANGLGIISNLNHVMAIIIDGYPLADVHLPGHMLMIALSFLVLGQNEYAAFFPSHISYLLSGLLLYWAGRQLANRWVGFYSAGLFLLFPSFIAYANTVFSELTLTFLAVLYFVVWLKMLLQPKLYQSFLLGVVFIAGMIHHETFLVFLPAAGYVLWRWPKPQRLKAVLLFSLTVIILFAFVFLPLYRARASYPHVLSAMFDGHNPRTISQLILENLYLSFDAIVRPEDYAWKVVMWLQYLAVPFCILSFRKFNQAQKVVAVYVLVSFLANFVGLTPFYPLKHRTSARVFMHLVPPALILVAIVIARIKPVALRYATAVGLAGLMLWSTLAYHTRLSERQVREYQGWQQFHQIVVRNLAGFQPKVIMLDGAFRYAWDYYPARVIYNSESIETTAQLQDLFQTITIDAIVVQERKQVRQRDLLSTLELQDYLLSHNYKFVKKDEGYFIFVRQAE